MRILLQSGLRNSPLVELLLRISMKQLIKELDESLRGYAHAENGRIPDSINVIPRTGYDIFSQVTIQCIVSFCRNHFLNYFVDLEEKKIHIYKPTSDSLSND